MLGSHSTTVLTGRKTVVFSIALLLCLGFVTTTLVSYQVSKRAIRDSIVTQELPLTSDTIYSEILKDLVRPVFVSSMMAHDTFLRDWTLRGEHDPNEIKRYLSEIMSKYTAFTSFYVSEKSRAYYHPSGILKKISPLEPRDSWYFRVRQLKDPYEINVDQDMANRDVLTIFVNYKVEDYNGQYLGAVGVGLTVDAVRTAIRDYQQRFGRDIFFVDHQGRIVLQSMRPGQQETNIHFIEGLRKLAPEILSNKNGSYQYENEGSVHLLNVRYIPELKWFLFVQKTEDEAMLGIRQTLYINLAVCLVITLVVLALTGATLGRYQNRVEELATTDKLTGLANRQAFDLLIRQAMNDAKRNQTPLAVLMADIDHFKEVNDRFGHLVGDEVLKGVATALKNGLRESDSVSRWGGEEFLVILKACGSEQARHLAEKLRLAVSSAPLWAELEVGAVSISLGVAELLPGDDMDALLGRADNALYEAKASGRNCVYSSAALLTLVPGSHGGDTNSDNSEDSGGNAPVA